MFLGLNCRDRAIGLIAAYALLIAGIFISGALDPAPAAQQATMPAVDRADAKLVDDCSYSLRERSDTVC